MKQFFVLILFFQATLFSQFELVPIRGDYLYMSATEVSNKQYKLFLADMKTCSPDSLAFYYPDTTCWKQEGSFNDPFVTYYFQHPAYVNYPVVGVSYEQVLGFCNWMTTYLNKQNPSKKVVVRLPTKKEWEQAATYNKTRYYAWEGSLGVDKKGNSNGNFIRGKGDYMGIAGDLKNKDDITAPVYSYKPNEFGLYNMCGNVAELVAEKGIVKGGGWRSRLADLNITKNGSYRKPSNDIGFRFVVQVEKYYDNQGKAQKLTKRYFKQYFKPISDTLLMGKVEVTNALYRAYLKDQKKLIKTNTNGWNNQFEYSEYYGQNYFYLAQYNDYPVVNITHKEAQDFCNWLTQKYEGLVKQKVTIRLPTKAEWIGAAHVVGSNYPWENNRLRDKKGNYQANFNSKNKSQTDFITEDNTPFTLYNFNDLQDFDGYGIANPVKAYSPNKKGLYGMGGNVAEMVQDNSLIMGGSWIHAYYLLQPRKYQKAISPYNPYTGFRVVMER